MATTRRTKTDTVNSEKVKSSKVKTITQFFSRYQKDTANTFRFEAISPQGKVLTQDKAEVSQLYIRKASPAMSENVRFLKVTVEVLDKLPSSSEEE